MKLKIQIHMKSVELLIKMFKIIKTLTDRVRATSIKFNIIQDGAEFSMFLEATLH